MSDEPIELTDLFATLGAILGEPLPDGAAPDSYDVSDAFFGDVGAGPIREAIVSHSENGSFAIRQGPWKLILGTDGSGGWVEPADEAPSEDRGGQLYHLGRDPGERTTSTTPSPQSSPGSASCCSPTRTAGEAPPERDRIAARLTRSRQKGGTLGSLAIPEDAPRPRRETAVLHSA